MKNKFRQRSCRKGNSGPRVEKQKNISGKRKLKSRGFYSCVLFVDFFH